MELICQFRPKPDTQLFFLCIIFSIFSVHLVPENKKNTHFDYQYVEVCKMLHIRHRNDLLENISFVRNKNKIR